MAAEKEKYCISHDLLGGVLSDLGAGSIAELMEKSEEEQEATKKRLIAYDPIAFESLTRRSTPYNLVDMGYVEAASRIKDWLESQTTVDVVEVVRCKDCKHWQPVHEYIPHMECNIFCGAYERGYPTNADDFCSYGERRTDEN